MSFFSNLFHIEKKEGQIESKVALGSHDIQVGTPLKIFADQEPLMLGKVSSISSNVFVITRRDGQPPLPVCRNGAAILAMSTDDAARVVIVLRGTASLSTEDQLRVDGMNITKMKNQRAGGRVFIKAPVLLDSYLPQKDEGTLTNISPGGLCLLTDCFYNIGDDRRLSVMVDGQAALTLTGRITRVEHNDAGGGKFRYGVHFQNLSRSDVGSLAQLLRSFRARTGTFNSIIQSEPDKCRAASDVLEDMMECAKLALDQYPAHQEEISRFAAQLEQAIKTRYPKTQKGGSEYTDVKEQVWLHITADGMAAYLCVLPPVVGDRPIDTNRVYTELRMRNVLHTVPEDVVKGVDFFQIVLLMEGVPALDGVDGEITELFRRTQLFDLLPYWKRNPDFTEAGTPQLVQRGQTICQVRMPVAGREGLDVTGKPVRCRRESELSLPVGKHVAVSPAQDALISEADGLLFYDAQKFHVQPRRVVFNGLHTNSKELKIHGILRVKEDLFVVGDIYNGVQVEAEGNIVVTGCIRDARVTSLNGIIRAQGGIMGHIGQTFISAKNQVQAKEIQYAQVTAEDAVVANSIQFCEIKCGDTVLARDGEGLIAGSRIVAKNQIICRRVDGSQRECSFSLGSDSDLAEKLKSIQQEIQEAQKALNKLWDSTAYLRQNRSTLFAEQEEIYRQLMEQRELYKASIRDLQRSRDSLLAEMDAIQDVQIIMEELEPNLEVQIGNQTDRFTQRSRKRCTISLKNGWIDAQY